MSHRKLHRLRGGYSDPLDMVMRQGREAVSALVDKLISQGVI